MSFIQESFGILSSIFITVGLIPYIFDIHYNRVHPQILSWTGWGFITGIGTVAMYSEGFTWGVAIVGANTLSCFFIAGYSTVKKVGVWTTSKWDWLFFVIGTIGLILWKIFDNPDLAILFAITADLSFGVPNLIKIYKNPASETYFPWVMATVSGFMSLFAISYISFTEIAYPIYLAIYDSTVLCMMLFIHKKRRHLDNK